MANRSFHIYCLVTILTIVAFGSTNYIIAQTSEIDSLVKAKDYSRAIEILEDLEKLALSDNNHEEFIQHEDKICKLLFKQKRCEVLQERTEKGIEYSRKNLKEHENQIARFLYYQGSCYSIINELDKALGILTDAELLLEKAGLVNLTKYKTIKEIATIHYLFEDYHNTILYSKKLEPLAYDLLSDKPLQLGDFHYLFGSAYWGIDERDSVKYHYELATKNYIEARGEEFQPLRYIYDVLGSYAWEADDSELALEYYSMAGKISSKKEVDDDADKLQAKATTLKEQGELEAALKNYKDAFEFRKEVLGTEHPGTIGCINYIVRTQVEMEDWEGAKANCQEALSLYCPGFNPKEFYDNPKDITNSKSQHYLLDVLILKFEILLGGDNELRAEALQSAMDVADLCLLTIDQLRRGNRAEETKLYWGNKVIPLYEQILDFYFENYQNYEDEVFVKKAFTLMEKSKGFLLAESIKGLNAIEVAGVQKSVLEKEKELSSQIADLKKFIYHEEKLCTYADDSKLEIWNSELASTQLSYEAFILELQKNYPEYHQLKYDISDVDLDDLQEKLTSDEGLLEMFIGTEKVYFVFFTKETLVFYRNENLVEIETATRKLHEQISSPWPALNNPQETWESFITSSHYLYNAILKPIQGVDYQQLSFIPDGLLNYIPLDILLTELPSADTRDYQSAPYFMRRKAIRNAPSASYLINTKDNKSSAEKYLGFAPSYARDNVISQESTSDSLWHNLPDLKFNENEVLGVSALFSGKKFLNEEAKEDYFKAHCSDASILHLAMHSIIDDENPLYSGFVFTQSEDSLEDGILSTAEIYSLEMKSQLAVLSACNSGFGKMERGEGVMSLARGFSYAGCPSILMSLWECDDASTEKIISSFFNTMADGSDKSESLRQARLTYLKDISGSEAHPYYWAGLSLIGNNNSIQPSDDSLFYWLAGALLFILIGLRIRKKRPSKY